MVSRRFSKSSCTYFSVELRIKVSARYVICRKLELLVFKIFHCHSGTVCRKKVNKYGITSDPFLNQLWDASPPNKTNALSRQNNKRLAFFLFFFIFSLIPFFYVFSFCLVLKGKRGKMVSIS